MTPILNIIKINKNFGGTIALDDFSLEIPQNSIIGIIGPNGAGKTTLFNVVTGFLPLDSGKIIYYNDEQLNGLPPHLIARLGIIRTFQQLRLIKRLSVLDNILLSFQNQAGEHLKNIFIFSGRIKGEERRNREKVRELLELMGIGEKANDLVDDLSYGQQKIVSLACCLASGANLFLLDEPVAGINPDTIQKILALIKKLQEEGKTIVLIEHNIDAIMQVCDIVVFMDEGKKIVEGDPESVRNNPAVLEAYLE
jgi:ABC-type branched-subunit amino acid transport system ATPase component